MRLAAETPRGTVTGTRTGFAAIAAMALAIATAMTSFWPGRIPLVPDLAASRVGATSVTPDEAFGSLPLAFVENRGQADERVRFSAQGPNYGFFFTPHEVVMSLSKGMTDGVDLALHFVGSNPDVTVEGTEPVGVVNYLRGSDPAAWHTEVPTFNGVMYRDLWPGIDMLLRDDRGELKYEFHVAPGADPADIRLSYSGADGLTLDRDGGLLIGTPHGDLRDAPPISYHKIDGTAVPVDSHYVVAGEEAADTYGFALGAGYVPAQPLVIDPGLDYATFVGGSSHDQAHAVAVDGGGNAVVVGTTQSDDFPTTSGAVDRTFNGGVMDVFVAKINADGSGLVYATYMGGTPAALRRGSEAPTDVARAVAVDSNGNAYVTGQTTSPDFPTTPGAFQPVINSDPDVVTDAFVAKLSPTGSLLYSSFLGGSFWEDGRDIAVDDSGSAYIVGETSSDNFPTTSDAIQSGRAGQRDAFVAKLNQSGSGLVYSTYLGGASELDRADAVSLDGAGAVYVAGSTRSVDFPTTPGALQAVHSGGDFANLFEVFVAKLDPTAPGSAGLVYSTFLGTSRTDFASDVAVDDVGSAHVTGSAGLSSDFPVTPGAYDTAGTTSSKGFVSKLDANGAALVYSTFFPVTRLALAPDGSAWLAGGTGAGAETTPDATAPENSGANDAYVARLSATGGSVEFGTFLGGTGSDNATAIALGAGGSVIVAGNTMSADFPTTTGAFDRAWAGDPAIFWGDAFVARFSADGAGDTTPPPPSRDTTTFSGRVDRNRTATHNLSIGAAGEVDVTLDWEESRASLTLRVRDPAGNTVLSDDGGARPKTATFAAAVAGTYRFEITNTSRRNTDYTLSVTHPPAQSSEPSPASLNTLSVSPTSVSGGATSTGTVTLTVGAPPGGASVLLSSSDPAVAAVPAGVTVAETQTSSTFAVSTTSVTVNTPVTISATYGGVTRTATLTVNAPDAGAVSALTLSPATVEGGGTSTATVTLSGGAPSGGALVTLFSSNEAVATVPASVTVPAGATSATFTVETSSQQFDQSSAISASYGGVTRSAILSVTAGQATTLSSLSLNPSAVTGGESSTGTVMLSGPAPSGGVVVQLSSSNTSAASVPSSVTVTAGDTSATFPISTSTVSSDTSSTVTAIHAGVTRSAALAVNAPVSTADTVRISRAEYDSDKRELRVEASSSAADATLRAYVTATGELIGTLSDGRGEFSWPANPQSVTVRSTLGGEASRDVTLK